MKKKLFTIILAFVMMTSFIVEVYAEEAQDNYGVEPFYTNTSLVTANLRLSGATAICNAQNVMTKNKKSKLFSHRGHNGKRGNLGAFLSIV